jgi:predicted DNA-binding protein YlxM (UPF0122 family)
VGGWIGGILMNVEYMKLITDDVLECIAEELDNSWDETEKYLEVLSDEDNIQYCNFMFDFMEQCEKLLIQEKNRFRLYQSQISRRELMERIVKKFGTDEIKLKVDLGKMAEDLKRHQALMLQSYIPKLPKL